MTTSTTPAIPISSIQKLIDTAGAGKRQTEIYIPLSYFSEHANLTTFQALVVYMREDLCMGWAEIGRQIGRSESTIRGTYNAAMARLEAAQDSTSNDTTIDTKTETEE